MNNIDKAIIVWPFGEAPETYRALSDNGGDEDWLAFVPDSLKNKYLPWLEQPHFGVCDVSVYPIAGGEIHIAAHS